MRPLPRTKCNGFYCKTNIVKCFTLNYHNFYIHYIYDTYYLDRASPLIYHTVFLLQDNKFFKTFVLRIIHIFKFTHFRPRSTCSNMSDHYLTSNLFIIATCENKILELWYLNTQWNHIPNFNLAKNRCKLSQILYQSLIICIVLRY